MHDIVAKIARLAVSKAAAFCYAVMVGVAGNLAFNFVQQHHTAPASASTPPEAAMSAAIPAAPKPPRPAPPPARAALSPPAVKPAAREAKLPEPPVVALPTPAALHAPAMRPAALPPSEGTMNQAAPAAAEAPVKPAPRADTPTTPPRQAAVGPAPTALVPDQPAGPPAASPNLPPLGEAIDVGSLPNPPLAPPQAHSSELSDVLHPSRAVANGLHGVGEQLGGDTAAPLAGRPAVGRPIPLLPSAEAKPTAADVDKGSPSGLIRPGPGSGGLY